MKYNAPLETLKEGMILAEDVPYHAGLLFPKGTVLSQFHIETLATFEFKTVPIDPTIHFDRLLEETVPKAMESLSKRVFRRGEAVCIQGDECHELFILLQGELDVIYTDEAFLRPGQDRAFKLRQVFDKGRKIGEIKGKMANFGEMGPLLDQNRSATIISRGDSIVASIPAQDKNFSKTILENPKLGLSLGVTLARRMDEIVSTISSYRKILQQLDAFWAKTSLQYLHLTERLRDLAIATKDNDLDDFLDEVKKSPLYNRLSRFKKPMVVLPEFENPAIIHERAAESLFFGLTKLEFAKDDILFQEGQDADAMLLLYSGELAVYKGDRLITVYKEKGDLIGTVRAVLGYAAKKQKTGKRSVTVKALSKGEYACLSSEEIEDLPKSSPKLVLHIARSLAARLSMTHKELASTLKLIQEILDRLGKDDSSVLAEFSRTLEFCLKIKKSLLPAAEIVKELRDLYNLSLSLERNMRSRLESTWAEPLLS